MTKPQTLYNITASELHAAIIEDLRAYCAHWGLDAGGLENEAERPLEQTIRLVIAAALDAAESGGETGGRGGRTRQ